MSLQYRGPAIGLLLFLVSTWCFSTASAQQQEWQILSPLPDSVVADEYLLIAVELPTSVQGEKLRLYIDNEQVKGNIRLAGQRLSYLHTTSLAPGQHKIRIETGVPEQQREWRFFYRNRDFAPTKRHPQVTLSGTVVAENRTTFLSGTGQDLRQEPNHTTSLGVDMVARYKNAELPVRIFLTSNNRFSTQSMNYYQVGFRNKWVELQAGDLNPDMDRLILTGVRLRGVGAKLKAGGSSIQFFTGELNRAYEGSLITYTPGSGMLPTNPVNDSQFIAPGTYKRAMSAVRIEVGNKTEIFKVGVNAFKAKDVVSSIRYGIAPKENLAGGLDLGLKLFKKSVTFQSGLAASILTNNISNGVINKTTLDTTFGIKLPFDPAAFKDIITLNASTVPASLENADFIAWYGTVNYVNKYQSFYVEYRRNGPLFNSLGNPFLRFNYDGFIVGERFALFKRKMSIDLNYQNYSNDLNQSLPVKVHTQNYRTNLTLNPGTKWPIVFLNYLGQFRDGRSNSESIQQVHDVLNNYVVGANLNRRFWDIDHHFRTMLNLSTRQDRLRPANQFTSWNATVGITERFSERYSLNLDVGKMSIVGADDKPIADYLTYNVSFDWQAHPQKLLLTAAFSNNTSFATEYTGTAHRMAALLRMRYNFYKGMGLDFEGGYQPYRNELNSAEDYDESYVFIRYTCDLAALLY